MTKDELVRQVADQTGLTINDTKNIVQTVFDTISDSLSTDEKIKISGFGTFAVKKRAAFKGRHPKTGEILDISESIQPVFEASKQLKEKVNKSNAT